MYLPVSVYRAASVTHHPPYGLYLDPHHGQHNWTAASTRVLAGLVAVFGSVLIVFALGPH